MKPVIQFIIVHILMICKRKVMVRLAVLGRAGCHAWFYDDGCPRRKARDMGAAQAAETHPRDRQGNQPPDVASQIGRAGASLKRCRGERRSLAVRSSMVVCNEQPAQAFRD